MKNVLSYYYNLIPTSIHQVNKQYRCYVDSQEYIMVECKDDLLALLKRFVDLADVFQKGYCYNSLMKGSFSIKSVLPALFPDDETLNYHNLADVHKGDEASDAYLNLQKLSKEDYNRMRESLLKYCELDTYAMVKIYFKLKELIL